MLINESTINSYGCLPSSISEASQGSRISDPWGHQVSSIPRPGSLMIQSGSILAVRYNKMDIGCAKGTAASAHSRLEGTGAKSTILA